MMKRACSSRVVLDVLAPGQTPTAASSRHRRVDYAILERQFAQLARGKQRVRAIDHDATEKWNGYFANIQRLP